MKYVVIRIRKVGKNCEWKCVYSSDDKKTAINICNDYNRLDENPHSRYTIYEESEV